VTVPQVYAAAKIQDPGHGFSLDKLSRMLTDGRLAEMDEASRANAIAVVLDASGVAVEEIVKDAVARDTALDRFEDFLTEKLISLEVELDEENEALREEIRRFVERKEAEIARNARRLFEKRVELARFRRVKRAEEKRLFEVIRPFTGDNPISVTGVQEGPAPEPPPPAPELPPEPEPEPAPPEPPPRPGEGEADA